MEAAKGQLIEEFNRRMSSVEGICNLMLDSELYHLGSIYMAMYPDQVRRCNADAIRQTAVNWILPGGEILLMRGPADTLKPELGSLGTIQELIP